MAASVHASDALVGSLHTSVNLADLSNVRQMEVHARFADIISSMDDIKDFFRMLNLWKVIVCSVLCFFTAVGLGSSIGEYDHDSSWTLEPDFVIAYCLGPVARWLCKGSFSVGLCLLDRAIC
jgi:hypothetical protein